MTDRTEREGLSQLTDAEQIFARRMLPHYLSGKSIAECARAVLEDDARLFNAYSDRRSSSFVPTADDRGRSYITPSKQGDLIANEISNAVYRKLRPTEALAGKGGDADGQQ